MEQSIDELIQMVPVGMHWLVRSMDEGDFLANITDETFEYGIIIGHIVSVQGSFMARGETPHAALQQALAYATNSRPKKRRQEMAIIRGGLA